MTDSQTSGPPPAESRRAWWQWPLYLRFAEYIALGTLAVGFWAQSKGLVQLVWTTSFLRRGMTLFAICVGLTLVVSAVQHGRRAGPTHAWKALPDMLGFVRDWAPMVVLLAGFENALMKVQAFNPRLLDMDLHRLDEVLFFGHAEAAIQALVRDWATPWVIWCYDALYVYPVVLGVWLFWVGKRWQARDFLVAFVVAGFVGYAGYVAVPAIGPAYYFGRPLPTVPYGGYVYDYAARFQVLASQPLLPRNCFPSLHTGWAVVVMLFSWRQARWLFWVFLGPLLVLIAATLYLRYHYLIDLVSGTALAVLVSALVPRLHAAWERARCGVAPPEAAELPPMRGRRFAWEFAVPMFLLVAPAVYLSGFSGLHAEEPARKKELLALGVTDQSAAPKRVIGAQFSTGGAPEIELVGVDVEPESAPVGGSFRLTLHWRSLRPVAGAWEVFVHVNGPGGTRANWDHKPLSGLHPIHAWQPGQHVRDAGVIELRASMAAGPGEIWVGLWDPPSGKRMAVVNPGKGKLDKDGRLLAATPALR
ncbi:MAG: phosphatase PAP2 family protein [Deltaproteobacteria bacterium]|nr:phosphatase PAP2 family protein [Deltaproteobacteria bacterium]